MEQGDRMEKNKREDKTGGHREGRQEISQILKGKTSSGKAKAARRGECCCLAKF